jgi:hypothetical protein
MQDIVAHRAEYMRNAMGERLSLGSLLSNVHRNDLLRLRLRLSGNEGEDEIIWPSWFEDGDQNVAHSS